METERGGIKYGTLDIQHMQRIRRKGRLDGWEEERKKKIQGTEGKGMEEEQERERERGDGRWR